MAGAGSRMDRPRAGRRPCPVRAPRRWPAGGDVRAARAMSVVLAFDTATAATVAGLRAACGETSGLRDDPAPGARPNHARRLLELADRLLADAGLRWSDVERIGVGVGPGTFTGLRIGVATARALAQASGAELVPVSTLEVLARAARRSGFGVLAAIDARRGEAFAARWDADGVCDLAQCALAPDALAALSPGSGAAALAVGDGAVRFREPLEAAGFSVPPDGDGLHLVAPG
ncbi:MAG: tRNA (adenosine(37)-N6)-threonylcarbamoyltransferase complex dimerization subunit type 1 TsaB, partial [Actinobacteria bacterium]|nr:tRNA (adenosine(37)-N6)-threonylcarbamoyltransferase complex dimerization subunit type 1 TsaB [Actinomycetota bacterium]